MKAKLADATYADADATRLGIRISKYRDQLFTFLDTPGVPSDNNHAERQIRPAVIIRWVINELTKRDRRSLGLQTRVTFNSPPSGVTSW